LPETVACPLQFWGFRHLIEIPAQQATPSGAPPPDQQDWISAEKPVNAVAGFHLGLRLVDEHRKKLEDLFTAPLASLRSQSDRDTVLALLDDETIDLAYFYCHARGGEVEGKRLDEILELQEAPSAQPGQIAPGDFGPVEWKHKPLVIINGCHTAGFSPRALSPFVRVFMGRKASGVIGTEIDVWEPFASEFARLFLKAFLGGASAGEAMRQARLQMLSINNPLGLVYTLFAGAQLRLKKPT
jgi:hypothetical protein